MERAIGKTIQQAEDVCAGLQVFADHVFQRDAGITESIEELIPVVKGLGELRLSVVQFRKLPTPIEADVRLLLLSLDFSLARIKFMFGQTRSKKLNGERPYAHLWTQYLNDIKKTEKLGLYERLELYSVFLKEILEDVRGHSGQPTAHAQDRRKLEVLLHIQQNSPQSGFNRNELPSPSSPNMAPPNMPGGFWPNSTAFPFPMDGDLLRPFTAGSPTMSSASWGSHSTQTGASAGSFSTHWAQNIFGGLHSSTPFPAELQRQSVIFARPMSDAYHRLTAERFIMVCRIPFEADQIECRFYCRPSDGRARLLILSTDRLRNLPVTYCMPVTSLKLTRNVSTLELCRLDRETRALERWVHLNFVDHERMVLFYSVFSALKNQDSIPPPIEIDQDYFYTVQAPEEAMFAGPTIYSNTNSLHALRIYRDRYTGGVRLEARPLRGPKRHVPIWTAFITDHLRSKSFVRRIDHHQIKLRRLDQHIFIDQYTPTVDPSSRFIIQFQRRIDCDDFIETLNKLATQ